MSSDPSEEGASSGALSETIVERTCRVLCELALVALVILISVEVVSRVFHFSFEFVDEIGGYLLSALTFLSLPVALIGGAYHQVEYFHDRLGVRGKAIADLFFALLSLLFTLVLEWQLWRLVTRSFASGVVAPTLLGTPMWIPQSAMLLGTAALIYSLCRVIVIRARTLLLAGAERTK